MLVAGPPGHKPQGAGVEAGPHAAPGILQDILQIEPMRGVQKMQNFQVTGTSFGFSIHDVWHSAVAGVLPLLTTLLFLVLTSLLASILLWPCWAAGVPVILVFMQLLGFLLLLGSCCC